MLRMLQISGLVSTPNTSNLELQDVYYVSDLPPCVRYIRAEIVLHSTRVKLMVCSFGI